MMRDRIVNGRKNAGDVGYEAWAERRLARGPAAHPFPAPPVSGDDQRRAPRRGPATGAPAAAPPPASGATSGGAAPPAAVVSPAAARAMLEYVDASPEAVALWRSVRAELDPGQTMLALSCLDALAPVSLDADALIVQDTNGSGEYALRNLGPQLDLLVAAQSAGAVTAVRRRPPAFNGQRPPPLV